jgi:hypothetical protein
MTMKTLSERRMIRAMKEDGRKLGNKMLAKGEVFESNFRQSVNAQPWWRRLPVAWRIFWGDY